MTTRRAALRGRPPSTSHLEVERAALEMFAREGFESTTMDDIADVVGVGRRTLFRYFPSKNDIVWGDFGLVLERLRADLHAHGSDVPTMEAIGNAVVTSNRYAPEQLPGLRIRMGLITTVPALQAHSMLRYGDWRGVVAEYVGERRGGRSADALLPQVIAHAALGVSMAAFGAWVASGDNALERRLREGFTELATGFPGADAPAVGAQPASGGALAR